MVYERISTSPDQTAAIGEAMARDLRWGDVVLLTGQLGAGKTCLTRGIARGLGAASDVSSPTFTTLHVHDVPAERDRIFCHYDVYRLNDADDFWNQGLDEYIFDGSISVIEWGDRVRDALPDEIIEVSLTYGDRPNERVLTVHAPDGRHFFEAEEA